MRHLLIAATLLFSLPVQAKLQIFACEPEWAALAQELGGNHVQIYAATTALQDPHLIQARPSLIAKMRKADLAICTGAELEAGWLPVLLQKSNNPKVQPGSPGHFIASQYVTLLDVPVRIDRSQGDIHAAGNPHIQGSPHNIRKIASPLTQRLQRLDPDHAHDYQRLFKDFQKRWHQAITHWESMAAELRGMPVISDHKGWSYLNHWLGLIEVASLEPKPGIPPSTAHLHSLLKMHQRKPAAAILQAAYYNPKPGRWLSKQAQIPVITLPFTVGSEVEAPDLFTLYGRTIQQLLSIQRP